MTLILLPGLLCDARVFAAQRERFPDAFIVDGFGARRTIKEMARHVIDNAPRNMALLGHSMGARVALEVFRSVPERVERLALVSTGVHGVAAGEAEKRHALRDLGYTAGAAALVDVWLPPMVAPQRRADPGFMAPLHRMSVEQGVEVYAAQIEALLDRTEAETLLSTIRCPVLVAVGSLDAWSPPAQHERIAAAIPSASLRVIEGAGHMLPVEAPDEFNDAIEEWLAWPP